MKHWFFDVSFVFQVWVRTAFVHFYDVMFDGSLTWRDCQYVGGIEARYLKPILVET